MMNNQEAAYRSTILVVDDAPDNLSLMSGLLKPDYKVKVANSGEKALLIAQGENKPDLILLDIVMPGLSGFDVIAALKTEEVTRSIPVIFLSGMDSPEDREKGMALGATDYITKPIDPAELVNGVRKVLTPV